MNGVTCIITAHHEGKFLVPSVNSIFRNFSNLNPKVRTELLLILDTPNSETIHFANQFKNDTIIHNVNFKDPSISRNFAVSQANFDFVAFLDGDDLWGSKWLSSVVERSTLSDRVIYHPEFNYYFSDKIIRSRNLIVQQISSNDPNFDKFLLASQNYWTAHSMGYKDIYLSNPFLPNDSNLSLGYEDWSFNVGTLKLGYQHHVVEETIHFIREKSGNSVSSTHSQNNSTFFPKNIWLTS